METGRVVVIPGDAIGPEVTLEVLQAPECRLEFVQATTGPFLERSGKIRDEDPEIETRELIVDNGCMQLVLDPHPFEVVVTTNPFSGIVSDICAGLTGGPGCQYRR